MQFTTEQTNPCTLVVSIDVEAEQVSRTFESVYREFSRFVSVPGFRPGKAPRALMEKYVNQARLQERVREKLVSEVGQKALEEQEIEPFRAPTLDAGEVTDKQPFSFKITVPLEPQVALGAYTGIQVERPLFPVTDEMVAERIERIQADRARVERITDRPVQAEDILVAEVAVEVEGEVVSPKRRQLLNLATSSSAVSEAVVGMNIDDEKTFDVVLDENFTQEEHRGKTGTYTVKVASISAKKLPEIDDAFAKELGYDSVDAFKEEIKSSIETESIRYSDQVAEQRIIQNILENSTINFPYALVREEMEDAYRQLAAELKRMNVGYEIWLQANGYTADSHREELEQVSQMRVATILALHNIATTENFQVSDEAIDAEFSNLLKQGRISEEQHDQWIDDTHRRFQIANALVQQDLHRFLFENNVIVDAVQSEAPDPEEVAIANEEAPVE